MKHIRRFLRDEEGATAVEYGVMVAAIAAVVIIAAIALGNRTRDTLNYVEGQMGPLST